MNYWSSLACEFHPERYARTCPNGFCRKVKTSRAEPVGIIFLRWLLNRTAAPDVFVQRPSLTFTDHVHEFNAGNGDGSRPE